ncbi:prenylyltransferase domain-containing periplasmic protein [Salinisphaera sp. PC39]|uniref:tol-pal system protein YbgF n=1 Tax=Salinisphaera sp. PC39 TaxID=1304156 RepID=UPI0033403520
MRLLATTAVLVAAAFPAALPAQQDRTALEMRLRSIEARLPDVDRLESLERKVAALSSGEAVQVAQSGGGGTGTVSLYQDIQALQQEVRELRGQIEELQYRARQREQRQRDLYQDLDSRLQALEKNAGIGPGTSAGDGSQDAAGDDRGGAGGGDPAAAEKAYLAAFEKLKQGDQQAAIADFQAFVKAHPDSDYTDNAWYWLGEAHYVGRAYDKALTAFRRVIQDFPDSNKVPDAGYKIGVIQDEQGQYAAARKTLQGVVDEHPDSDAAGLARKRLEALKESGGQ